MLIEILFHFFVFLLELWLDVGSHFLVNFSDDLIYGIWVENLDGILVIETDCSLLLELLDYHFGLHFL